MGKRRFPTVGLAAFLGLVIGSGIQSAVATSPDSSPYRTQMSLSQVYEVATSTGSSREVEVVPTVRVKGRIRGVGFVDARFNVRRNKTWRSTIRRGDRESLDSIEPVLLQGRLAVGGAWKKTGRRIHPSAASIIGKELRLVFPGRAKGSKGSRQRVYTIKMTLDGAIVVQARVSSIPSSIGRRGACGAAVGSGSVAMSGVAQSSDQELHATSHAESSIVPPITGNSELSPTALSRVVTISTDADQEWFQRYGDQSNAVIASIVNTAEAVYNRQLGLRFRIVKQHVYSDNSPYTSAEAGALLTTFTRNPENATNLSDEPSTFQDEVDLKHLFTGKDIEGSIIGIAYIGVVCAVPSLSYGITQAYMDVANPGIFAHEVAHNFGASHDSSTRDGLMYPSISIPPSDKFSDFSLGEMNGHISKYGTCISLEQMVPRADVTPGPDVKIPTEPPLSSATITIRRDRVGDPRNPVVMVSGTIISGAGKPLSALGIRLMVSGEKVGSAVTTEQGTFKFFIRLDLPRDRQVYVYAETEGGEVFSNFLWMSKTRPLSSSRSGRSGRATR
jgi:hypothetical protein